MNKLVAIGEAAEYLGVSIDTIRRWDKKGDLHPIRDSHNRRMFSVVELEEIKNNQPLTISAAAAELGISNSSLRRYEKQGLIKPQRNDIDERRYTRNILKEFEKARSSIQPLAKGWTEAKGWVTQPLAKGWVKWFDSLTSLTDEMKMRALVFSSFAIVVGLVGISSFLFLYTIQTSEVNKPGIQNIASEIVHRLFPRGNSTSNFAENPSILGERAVLAQESPSLIDIVTFNIQASFNKLLSANSGLEVAGVSTFAGNLSARGFALDLGTGKITAGNVVYSITAGDNITLTGTQDVTISAKETGVTTLQGSKGALSLSSGSGISISGLTITNSDKGSSQSIFKNIAVSGQSDIAADGNDDTLTFVGSGITITTAVSTDTITFTSNATADTGWTDDGTAVRLSTISDSVGIGTSSPSTKLHVVGATTLAGNTTLGSAITDSITFTGRIASDFVPISNGTYSLGSDSFRWSKLYVNGIATVGGQALFTNTPTGTGVGDGVIYINPASVADTSYTLFGIAVGGVEKLRMDAAGNITVQGDLLGPTGGSIGYWTRSGTTLRPYTDGDNIVTTGNIGVGTTTPAGKLDITDTSNTAASLSLTNNTATTIGNGGNTLGVLDLQSTSLTTGNFLNAEVNALTSGKGFNLTSTSTAMTGQLANISLSGSNAANTGNLLLIADSGALNTTTPFKVTAAGAATQVAALIENTGSGTSFRVNDEASDTTPFLIDASGNVGIGTTSPGAKLEVNGKAIIGDGTQAQQLVVDAGGPSLTTTDIMVMKSATYPYFQFVNNSSGGAVGDGFKIGLEDTRGTIAVKENWPLDFYTNNAVKMTIDNNGNVGIGTTGPSYKLDLSSGRIRTSAGTTAGGIQTEASATNMVTNPSFEVDTTGWTNNSNTTFERSTTQSYFGGASLHIIIDSIADSTTMNVTTLASTTYTISAYVYKVSGTEAVTFQLTDNIDQALGCGSLAVTLNQWTRVTCTVTTDSHTNRVLTLYPDPGVLNSGEVYWDGIQLEQNSYATSYTDGSMGPGYTWTGTAHASTSTRTAETFVVDNTGLIHGLGVDYTGSRTALVVNQGATGDVLNLFNGSTELLTVLPSGKVGIGTTGPTVKLDVAGAAVASTAENIAKFSMSDNATNYLSIFNNTGADAKFDPAFLGYTADSDRSPMVFIGGVLAASDTGTTPLVNFQARRGNTSGSAVVNRDLFDFANYGTSVMRITSTGNVGIGTTAPAARLSLGSDAVATNKLYLWDGSNNDKYGFGIQGGTLQIYSGAIANPTNIAFGKYDGTTFTEFMRIQNGNVGIGTTGPGSKLDVIGNQYISGALGIGTTASSIVGLIVKSPGGGGNHIQEWKNSSGTTKSYMDWDGTISWNGLAISSTGVLTVNMGVGARLGGASVSSPAFSFTNDTDTGLYHPGDWDTLPNTLGLVTGGSERIRIDSAGNVGIGTTGPTGLLHVRKDQNDVTYIKVENDTAGTAAQAIFSAINDTGELLNLSMTSASYTSSGAYKADTGYMVSSGTGGMSIGAINATSGDIRFYTDGSADANQRMVIKNDGNVGIGTTGPRTQLELRSSSPYITLSNPNNGEARTGFVYYSGSGDTERARLEFSTNATNPYQGDLIYTTKGYSGTPSDVRLFVNGNSGNVGIGTTNPLAKLHVVGNCVTGDTMLPIRRRRRRKSNNESDIEDDLWDYFLSRIDEVQIGDEVLSLAIEGQSNLGDKRDMRSEDQGNIGSGTLEWHTINNLIDMGIQDVYELTTKSGRKIRTTSEHPFLAQIN